MDISSVPLDTQLRTQPAAPYEADNTINSAAEGSISAQSTEQDTSTADTKRGGSRVILGGGAIAGITIAGVFIITLSGFVLARTLADKDRKKHDTDISAKLDYITELREGDLDGPEDQHQPGRPCLAIPDDPQLLDMSKWSSTHYAWSLPSAVVCVYDTGSGCDACPYAAVGDVAQQGCRSGSAGHSSLWSWLRKADTPKPSQSQVSFAFAVQSMILILFFLGSASVCSHHKLHNLQLASATNTEYFPARYYGAAITNLPNR